MALTLQNYVTDTQRLLHDATFKYYLADEIFDYINKARKLVSAETGCTRHIIPINIAAATSLTQATYSMDTLITTPVAKRVIDVLDVLLLYSANTVYQLRYLPFSTMVRTGLWQTQYAGTPTYYTINNRQLLILQWPAIAYPNSTIDCLVEPVDLSLLTDAETDLAFPYTECVAFYAAYLAKVKDQSRKEAEEFFKDYQRRKVQAIGAEFSRRLVGR